MNDYTKKYELIQFSEDSRVITYKPDFPRSWYEGMNIYAIFKVKLTDNRNSFKKRFFKRQWNRYWYRNVITNQINFKYD